MATDFKLEAYLTALDRALKSISVGDRADIIAEIKSHILDAKEKNPEQSIESILTSIGEPETVANRYLIERGLKPGKASRSPIVKWLTIGFLGTFGIFVVFVISILWFFSPILKIDEEQNRVEILGGMIDINGTEGSLKLGGDLKIKGKDFLYENDDMNTGRTIEGEKQINSKLA